MTRVRERSAELARDGYVHLPGLLDPAAVAALTVAAERLLAAPLPAGCERPHNILAPLRWHDPAVTVVLGDASRRHRLATALGATDPRWISGYVSVKDPHSPPLWWHQDWWCWDHPVSFAPTAAQVAVAMDYRLLHGTHANGTGQRRLGVLLNFAPAWTDLPADVRGHLIQHPALPEPDEDPAAARQWLPDHAGPRRDLPLNRRAAPARPGAPSPAAFG